MKGEFSIRSHVVELLLLLNATQTHPEDVPCGLGSGAVGDESGPLGTSCHLETCRLRLPSVISG